MCQIIENKRYDEERALYHLQDSRVIHCAFEGPADGESALKESRNVTVRECDFSLRYPLWHAKRFQLLKSRMSDTARAPIWYAEDGLIGDCDIRGVKALRECERISIIDSKIQSPEFGWKCRGVEIADSTVESEYFLLESRNVKLNRVQMRGKYSFQYVEDMVINNSVLDTKDAFWHSKNVTVCNSVVKGEYLGWFAEGLTLVNCKIIGTQPLCYCKGLVLEDCEMIETDLAFEYSEVDAKIKGDILSVKNPGSGRIIADSIGEIIREGSIMDGHADIIQTKPLI